MEMTTPEIRLGSMRVVFQEGRRFVFSDAHRAHCSVEIDDADVPDLLVFLHQWSRVLGQHQIEIKPLAPNGAGS